MKKNLFLSLILVSTSCKLLSNSDDIYSDKTEEYKLRLNPATGSKYHYDIINESETNLEANGNKIKNINRTTVGMLYEINKDSTGNYLIAMTYNKILIYSKNGDVETDLDAANAKFSINPMEKMLGVLKDANILATVTPAGVVTNVSGYNEMTDRMMAGLTLEDEQERNVAKAQWEQFIEKGMVKKNMDQMFKMFPDSSVHVGDKWKLISKQNADFSLNVQTFYQLKSINNDIALIKYEGEMVSDSSTTKMMGYDVQADVKGSQEGEFEIESKTGMLLHNKTSAKLKGRIQMMGTEVPLVVKITMKIDGEKIK